MRVLCLVSLALVALAGTAPAQQRLMNGIAALANDAIITYQEVEVYALPALEVLYKTYFSQPEVYEQKRRETFKKALDDLIEKQLMLDEFKAQGGVLPEGILEDQIKTRIRESYGGDRSSLTRTLKEQGITLETFRKRVRDEIIVNYMRSKNIAQAILISPAKIELYYATNLTQFKVGEQVRLRMIVLVAGSGNSQEALRRMEEILALIDAGAAFAEMATVYSEGSQGREGGDWKWIDRTVLHRGLSDVAFTLQPGQHSGVIGLAREPSGNYWTYLYDKSGRITTARHYPPKGEMIEEKKLDGALAAQEALLPPQEFYIEKVEDRRGARTLTLEEVRDDIEKNLIGLERARLQRRWAGRLREKSFIRMF
jgi:peptidyl-prolyl cis-trans isomerase SurA